MNMLTVLYPCSSAHAELVSNLVSNWGKLDPTIPNDKKRDNWVAWKTPQRMYLPSFHRHPISWFLVKRLLAH
jgi:hypothetical protein